jgi:putative thioredoxin
MNPHSSSTENVIDTHYETFQKEVIDASFHRPVLLDMWADWCPPCLVIGPILKSLAEEYNGQVLLAKIEVDEGENMKIAGQYKVRGFPTVILIQNGEEKARFSGAKPKHFIAQMVQEHFVLG